MTTPTGLEFLSPKTPQATQDPNKIPSGLDFLTTEPEQKQQGFMDYVSNLGTNYLKTGSFLTLLDPTLLNANIARQGEGSIMAVKDLGKIFNKVLSYTPDPVGAARLVADLQGVKNPFSSENLSGMPLGLLKPIGDLMDLSSGLKLEEDTPRPLTPEESADRIKGAVALAASSAIAPGVSGAFGKNLIGKFGAGAITGGSYGFIAGAGSDDQIKQAWQNGILGGGLGLIIPHGSKEAKPGNVKPSDVALARAAIDDGNTLAEMLKTGRFLNNANDLASALLSGKLDLQRGDVHVIPGIDPTKITSEYNIPEGYNTAIHINKDGTANLLVYDGALSKPLFEMTPKLPSGQEFKFGAEQRYKNLPPYFWEYGYWIPEGSAVVPPEIGPMTPSEMSNLLAYHALQIAEATDLAKSAINDSFFEKYGVLNNQHVSYLGKDNWKIEGDTKDGLLKLRNTIDGNLIDAHPNDVQTPPNVTFDNVRQTFIDRFYQQWKDFTAPELASKKTEKYNPIGFDETPPETMLEAHPENDQFGILNKLNAFLESKNLGPNLTKQLKWDLQKRLVDEAYGTMDPEDLALVKEGQRLYQQDTRTAKEKVQDFNSLQRFAKFHGFDISDGSSGRYIIHDLATKRILKGVDNIDEAKEWITKAGRPSGPKLDDNSTIDTNIAAGGNSLPPEGPPQYPGDEWANYAFSNANAGEPLIKLLDNFPIITRYRNYFTHLDSVYDGRTLDTFFEPVMEARNIRNANAKSFAERLGNIKKRYGLGTSQVEKLRQYMETMSPEEVIARFMSRPMNPVEIGLSRQIAGLNVNLASTFKYMRALEGLDKDFPVEARQADPETALKYQQQVQAAREAFQIDDDHLKAASIMNDVKDYPIDKIALGAVIRLARALNDGTGAKELTRAEFAAKHKLDPRVIAASNEIDQLYKDLARRFNIPENNQLGGYITHAKLYFNGDVQKAFNQFSGPTAAKDFFAKLVRTGEINAFETDPFKSTLRYIKSGFDVQSGFNDALREARAKINDQAKKISDPGVAGQFLKVVDRFLSEAQGVPAAADRASKEVIERVFSSRYKIADDLVKSSWSSALASVINAGALGFRTFLGAVHFGTSLAISEADRGFNYTRRMLINGAKTLANKDAVEDLRAKGVFTGLSPFSIMDADVNPASKVGRVTGVLDQASNIAFKATLLPTIYDMMVAGHYTTTYADALENLTKLSRGEISAKQIDKALFLKHYDYAVARRFKEISLQNIGDAAHYLAKNAVEDLVGTYGQGNTPYMWGSKFGRMFGQYGNFSMWIRGTLQRMLSRGTNADRITALAKLAAWHYTMKKSSEETGIDLTKLDPYHGLWWVGGPIESYIKDAATAMKGDGYEQNQATNRLLRILPVDSNGNFHPSIFIPASYAIDGLAQAAQQFEQGNDLQGVLQAIGFRKYKAAQALGRGIP